MRARSYTWRMFPDVMSQSLKYDWITPCNSRFLASSSEACSHGMFPETCEILGKKELRQKAGNSHKHGHRGSQGSLQGAEQARLSCCNEGVQSLQALKHPYALTKSEQALKFC